MGVDALGGLSDVELAERLAAGDTQALEQLYDRYGSLAYSVSVRVLGDPGKAEDVVQDVFLKLWNNAARFDSQKGSLRTWLMTAVRNRSIDYLRGRGAHERIEKEIPEHVEASGVGSDPWREVAAGLERDAVKAAIETLPPDQRQAVELAYFGGYSHREIAEMIRVPLSTVKGRMRLALEKLHSYLQGRGFVYE
ncbi:MAG: sigma-70 family RNA polymerase sigma factor [Candidatus Dormibacteraceae bacterium]